MTPADEVDALISAWQRERPDLDVAPMQVLSRVTRLARHLDIARREAFEAPCDPVGPPFPGRLRRSQRFFNNSMD